MAPGANARFHLFLDDVRLPGEVDWVELPAVEWTVVRSFDAFVAVVCERGVPTTVSFDHDLCDEHYAALAEAPPAADAPAREFREKTGYHCAEWLVEHCRQQGLALPAAVHVHTLNTAGGARIEALVARARADGA